MKTKNADKAQLIDILTTTVSDMVIRRLNPGLADSWPLNRYLIHLYDIRDVNMPVYPTPMTQFERQANNRTNRSTIFLGDGLELLVMQRNPNTIILKLSKGSEIYSSLLGKLREIEKSFEVKLLFEENSESSTLPIPPLSDIQGSIRVRRADYVSFSGNWFYQAGSEIDLM